MGWETPGMDRLEKIWVGIALLAIVGLMLAIFHSFWYHNVTAPTAIEQKK